MKLTEIVKGQTLLSRVYANECIKSVFKGKSTAFSQLNQSLFFPLATFEKNDRQDTRNNIANREGPPNA